MACAPSEDSDQPGHLPSLVRVLAVCMKEPWVLSYPMSAQRRLWSDCADAQADLSLWWARRSFLARLYVRSTRRAIVVTPVIRVLIRIPVTLRQSFICKFFRSSYLDSHSSESIHIWTIGTLEGRLSFHDSWPQGPCPGVELEVKI